jgi:hypothetical protein
MIPHITKEQAFAIDKDDPDYWFATVNGRIDKANAQQETYITADEARKLGAGNTEWRHSIYKPDWTLCGKRCEYKSVIDGTHLQYRTIKQSQPEPADPTKLLGEIYGFLQSTCPEGIADEAFRVVPESLRAQAIAKHVEPRDEVGECVRHTQEAGRAEVDPHATLRAEYAKQVALGTTGFYLWEYRFSSNQAWTPLDHEEFFPDHRYRYTDISCYVSKDGESAIRMLRTEARELQRQTKDTHDWFAPAGTGPYQAMFEFTHNGTYTYHTKATIKLNGNMVTPKHAAAEWETKKETHELWFKFPSMEWSDVIGYPKNMAEYFEGCSRSYYELRTKKPNLKQLDWSKVPVGVMTNRGELRAAYIDYEGSFTADVESLDVTHAGINLNAVLIKHLRLAPASDQPWLYWGGGECPVPEGCTYETRMRDQCIQKGVYSWSHDNNITDADVQVIAYRITGLADGYTDGGVV